MSHLLVTNDFPPKTGGIQTYLWELWRRLPAETTHVLTTSYSGADDFDRNSPISITRVPQRVLLPTPALARTIAEICKSRGISLVIYDPALPLGLVGSRVGIDYLIIVHGAELTVPGRLPVAAGLIRREFARARGVIAAGGYPANEASRLVSPGMVPQIKVVMPGVDTTRFTPLSAPDRLEARRYLGLSKSGPVVASVSRLVPRKGMDTLIRAGALLSGEFPGLQVVIGGDGRDRGRLERLANSLSAPVRFLGEISHETLPQVYGSSDLFVMACRDRWFHLEQEGFGVVFLEAAACGVPQIAGASGGSHEAVLHDKSGLVLENSSDHIEVAGKIRSLLADPERRADMGNHARHRVVQEFDYDYLSRKLADVIGEFDP